MPDSSSNHKSFVASTLRLFGFVFLILGVPVLIFLPEVFDVPQGWEKEVESVLLGLATILGGFLAGGTTYFFYLALKEFPTNGSKKHPIRISIYLGILAWFSFVMWWVTISGAKQFILLW